MKASLRRWWLKTAEWKWGGGRACHRQSILLGRIAEFHRTWPDSKRNHYTVNFQDWAADRLILFRHICLMITFIYLFWTKNKLTYFINRGALSFQAWLFTDNIEPVIKILTGSKLALREKSASHHSIFPSSTKFLTEKLRLKLH